ncbi:hypothetical protein [Amycolatopsis sp. NPDC001319]|uniref:hypothetical protein n=1 Tax=unclassified Amycolatopsis TaxID=2618356 RepID=UPI00367C1F3B
MTLNTSIAIGKPYPVRQVFDFCRELLNTPEGTPFSEEHSSWRKGVKQIFNPCGIGLPAWLWIYYGADGPMVETPDDPSDEDEVEYIARTPTKNGWAAMEVTFDTAYGYRGPDGESCSQLHARLVAQLGKWLDAKGLPWKWQNEYTGEWFDGYDGLAELVGAHESTGADEWFRGTVLPLIAGGAL